MTNYVYIASAGETFDSVAREVYGDEKYAAEILCANPEVCGKGVFDGGEHLRLPWVQLPPEGGPGTSVVPDKAPWKE